MRSLFTKLLVIIGLGMWCWGAGQALAFGGIGNTGALETVEYADLCNATRLIHTDEAYIPAGFWLVTYQSDQPMPVAPGREVLSDAGRRDGSGFQAAAFQQIDSGDLIVVFGGTEGEPEDILADLGIFANEIDSLKQAIVLLTTPKDGPEHPDPIEKEKALAIVRAARKKNLDAPREIVRQQLEEARAFYRRVVQIVSARRRFERLHRSEPSGPRMPAITIAGHSLGGYLGQIVCAENDVPGITFNAPGAAGLASTTEGAVVNHRRRHDLVGIYGWKIGTEVTYPDVPMQVSNLPKPFFVRNHLITQFLQDLRDGLLPFPDDPYASGATWVWGGPGRIPPSRDVRKREKKP